MTREQIEELKRLHEAACAHEGGHGVSDAPLHEFRQAMLAALPRLLLERERAVNALKDILEPPKGGGFRSIPMEEGLAALAFVEEEA